MKTREGDEGEKKDAEGGRLEAEVRRRLREMREADMKMWREMEPRRKKGRERGVRERKTDARRRNKQR